jgi:hypothetical protein
MVPASRHAHTGSAQHAAASGPRAPPPALRQLQRARELWSSWHAVTAARLSRHRQAPAAGMSCAAARAAGTPAARTGIITASQAQAQQPVRASHSPSPRQQPFILTTKDEDTIAAVVTGACCIAGRSVQP